MHEIKSIISHTEFLGFVFFKRFSSIIKHCYLAVGIVKDAESKNNKQKNNGSIKLNHLWQ